MTDVGTTEAHLGELLLRWKEGLDAMENRTETYDASPENNVRVKMLKDSIALLIIYIGKQAPSLSTVDSRYAHLSPMYEQWSAVLALAQRFKTTACLAVTEKLRSATSLLYNYMSEDMSTYQISRLIDNSTT